MIKVFVIGALFLSTAAVADDAPSSGPRPYRPLPSLYQWEVSGAPSDPIEKVDRHMGKIVGQLADAKTDMPVQSQQKKVVSELDSLIKELEEQQKKKASGSGSNPNPTKPMEHSQLAGGPGGSGPLHDPRSGAHTWGDLPPKEREQILQSQTEGFPPGYEAVLSSYYNHLAQEKVSTDSSSPAPATRPSKP